MRLILRLQSYGRIGIKNDQHYAPLECLDQHLKMLQIINYEEKRSVRNFFKFFVLNARVLEHIKVIVRHRKCDKKWIAHQHEKLEVKGRSSRGATFDFEVDNNYWSSSLVHMKHIHDVAMDQFDESLCRCHGDAYL